MPGPPDLYPPPPYLYAVGDSTLPDTGSRSGFEVGGAVREDDPDKPAMEGISPFAAVRLGEHLSRGAQKYGDMRNWEKGMPYTRCIGAILRHTFAYLRGGDEEDHLAAIMWNAMALIHYEEVGDPDLDDRPLW